MLPKGGFEGSPLQDSPANRSKSAPKDKLHSIHVDRRGRSSVKLRKREKSAETTSHGTQLQSSQKNSVVLGRQSLQLGRISGLDASTHIGVMTCTGTANSSFWGGLEPLTGLQIPNSSTMNSVNPQLAPTHKPQRCPPKISPPAQNSDILDSLERLEQQYSKKTALLTAELQKATTAHARDIDLWQQERSRHEEKQRHLEEQIVKIRNELEMQRVDKAAAIDKLKKTLKHKDEQFEKAFLLLEEKAKECIAAEKAQFEAKLTQINEGWKLKLEKATFELSSSACLQLESSRKELDALRRDLETALLDKSALECSNSALSQELSVLKHKKTAKDQQTQANTLPAPPTTNNFSGQAVDESAAGCELKNKSLERKVGELGRVVQDKEEEVLRLQREVIGLKDKFREYVRSQLSLKRGLASVLEGAN